MPRWRIKNNSKKRRAVWTIDDDGEEPIEEVEEELKTYDDKPVVKRAEATEEIYDTIFDYRFEQNTSLASKSIVRITRWTCQVTLSSGTENLDYTIVVTKNNGIFCFQTTERILPKTECDLAWAVSDIGISSLDEVLDAEVGFFEDRTLWYLSVKEKGLYYLDSRDLSGWQQTDIPGDSTYSIYSIRQYPKYQILCFGLTNPETYTGSDSVGAVNIALVENLSEGWTTNDTLPKNIIAICSCYDESTGYYFVGFDKNTSGNGGVWVTDDPLGTWYQASEDLGKTEIKSIVCANGLIKVGGDGVWETTDILKGFTRNSTIPSGTGYIISYDSYRGIWWAVPTSSGYSTYYSTDGTKWKVNSSMPTTDAGTSAYPHNGVFYIGTDGAGLYTMSCRAETVLLTSSSESAESANTEETTTPQPILCRAETLQDINTLNNRLATALSIEETTENSSSSSSSSQEPILIRQSAIQKEQSKAQIIKDTLDSL